MNFRWWGGGLIVVWCLLLPSYFVFAQQEKAPPPLEAQLTLERTTLTTGEAAQATLILRNTSIYTLTNLTVRFQGTTFQANSLASVPDTLSPYASTTIDYTLKSQMTGSHNTAFVVQYSWNDPEIGFARQWSEIVAVDGVEVTSWFDFDWPDYLIPLIIGLFVGWLSSWFTDWRKQRQEDWQREEQARGVVLAVLQAARKGVETKEKISFVLWDEAIVKGNLYPALHQLGRTMGKPELSKRLAELSIIVTEYNQRQETKNLTESFADQLVGELTDLIRIVENKK